MRRRDERVDACVERGEAAHHAIRRILDDALRELLPLDADRVREHRVGQQLRLAAVHDPALATLAQQAHRRLHRRVATAVGNGTRCGEVEPGVDTGVAATRILSAAYGLAEVLALSDSMRRSGRSRQLHDVLDPVVATVFTGRCRRHD